MAIVDSHLHLHLNGLSLEDIVSYLDRNRIDCCWLLSWEETYPGQWPYQHLSVEDIYEAYLRYPRRIIPCYAPDPHRRDAPAKLEEWGSRGIRGCGELKATIGWNSDSLGPILNTAQKLKMPVIFHMEKSEVRYIPCSDSFGDRLISGALSTKDRRYKIPHVAFEFLTKNFTPLRNRTKSYFFPGYLLDFASLEVTLQRYPEVSFVAHGPAFWERFCLDSRARKQPLSEDTISSHLVIWRLLRDYGNLFADLSAASGFNAMLQDRRETTRFISMFQDKLLYGTDNYIKGQRQFLDSLGLSKSIYRKLYGDNATKIMATRAAK